MGRTDTRNDNVREILNQLFERAVDESYCVDEHLFKDQLDNLFVGWQS